MTALQATGSWRTTTFDVHPFRQIVNIFQDSEKAPLSREPAEESWGWNRGLKSHRSRKKSFAQAQKLCSVLGTPADPANVLTFKEQLGD